MSKMRVVQVTHPNGPLELVEREIPEPTRGQVRIKVEACGICYSDTVVREGHWPGIQYPRVPGHEIAGRVDAVGADVSNTACAQCFPGHGGVNIIRVFSRDETTHIPCGGAG